MYKEFPWWSKSLTLAAVMSLSACGGGGDSSGGDTSNTGGTNSVTTYSGVTAAATLDSSNVDELVTGASLTAVQLSKNSASAEASLSLLSAVDLQTQDIDPVTWIIDHVEMMSIVSGLDISSDSCNGGIEGNPPNGTANFAGTFLDATITFNACEASPGVFFTGTAFMTSPNYPNEINVTLQNFDVVVEGETHTIENIAVSCTLDGGNVSECSTNSDFTGSDGQVYRLTNTEVTGDNDSGYTVSGTYYHPTYGHADFSATGFTYCANEHPGAGTLTITTGVASATVEFTSCDEFTITFDNVSTLIAWADL